MTNQEGFGAYFGRTNNLLNDIDGADIPQDPEFTDIVREGLLSKVDDTYPPEGHGYPRSTT